jgi:hypothetical protein
VNTLTIHLHNNYDGFDHDGIHLYIHVLWDLAIGMARHAELSGFHEVAEENSGDTDKAKVVR